MADLPEGLTLVPSDQSQPQSTPNALPEGLSLVDPNAQQEQPKTEDKPKSFWDNASDYLSNVGHQTQKGIPIYGATVKDTPEQSQWEKDNPTASGISKVGGTVAAAAPIAAGIAAFGPEALLAQVGLNAAGFSGLSGADEWMRGGDSQDIKNKAIIGGIGGALGPAAGPVLSGGLKGLGNANLADPLLSGLGYVKGGMEGGVLGHLMSGWISNAAKTAGKTVDEFTKIPAVKSILSALSSGGATAIPSNDPANSVKVPNGD